ncbi:hypothetical protein AMAG_11033 [Allomyces macrogynus ATCC 38327]|uniref:Chromatin modification-related protein n=1 Tax=Allomyces macrogynus (strain ATCC 38327) TaxID=578462 RepID=A0A0L0SSC0_ALLM3|nr:hypothetical protein AMAG_11033 [Allomyces macrogynus ATCC 38327]|eukprot:KNE65402.1 hypothetical protein AMAG_11033 [Allomyces macrogynus ATCC 38327]
MQLGKSPYAAAFDAANYLDDFLSSLDNLPAEVQHLLTELREKDVQYQELSNVILQKQKKLYKYERTDTTPTSQMTRLQDAIRAHYTQVATLQDEKLLMARKLVDLIDRHIKRMDADLMRVRDDWEDVARNAVATAAAAVDGIAAARAHDDGGGGGGADTPVVGSRKRRAAGAAGGAETPLRAGSVSDAYTTPVAQILGAVTAHATGSTARSRRKRARKADEVADALPAASVDAVWTPLAMPPPPPPPPTAGPNVTLVGAAPASSARRHRAAGGAAAAAATPAQKNGLPRRAASAAAVAAATRAVAADDDDDDLDDDDAVPDDDEDDDDDADAGDEDDDDLDASVGDSDDEVRATPVRPTSAGSRKRVIVDDDDESLASRAAAAAAAPVTAATAARRASTTQQPKRNRRGGAGSQRQAQATAAATATAAAEAAAAAAVASSQQVIVEEEIGDDTPYCYCRQPSYGQMIGCDNKRCKVEWFHYECVGLPAGPPPDLWYCRDCAAALTKAGGRA